VHTKRGFVPGVERGCRSSAKQSSHCSRMAALAAFGMKYPAELYSQVFAGQKVGIREVSEKIWLVTFMHYET